MLIKFATSTILALLATGGANADLLTQSGLPTLSVTATGTGGIKETFMPYAGKTLICPINYTYYCARVLANGTPQVNRPQYQNKTCANYVTGTSGWNKSLNEGDFFATLSTSGLTVYNVNCPTALNNDCKPTNTINTTVCYAGWN
jgi:hypothetical protein